MILKMAWRNIWRNKIRSALIILSITIGLFAGIAVLAIYDGMMKSRVRTVIESEVGHIQLHDIQFKENDEPKYILKSGNNILTTIQQLPQVSIATPRSITMGMLSSVTGSSGVQINGIIPELEYKIAHLNQKIVDGKIYDSTKKNQIIIGEKLAHKLKINLSSKLVLTLTDSSGSMVAGSFRVCAIYRSANAPLDERMIYITMQDLNALLLIGNSFHEIAVLLKNDNHVNAVQKILKQKYPSLQIQNWQEISPETNLLVKTVNQYAYIIIVIIMMALSFGIINTMLMAVLERTREIGMMVALGTNRSILFKLVLLETIFLTTAGAPIGIFVSWLVANYYHRHGIDLSSDGTEMLRSFGFNAMIYPEFPTHALLYVLLIVIITAIISSLLPALKAVKLQPIEALSH